MQGFFNQLLDIDLNTRSGQVMPLPDKMLAETLGGKGLAIRLLLAQNPPGVDPLSPENRLIFATGPLTGTPLWGSCRHGVFTKSPQTGFFSESYSGGTAAEPMAASGFDAVVIKGAADKPVWLEISPEGMRSHPAEEIWGMDTFAAEDWVKDWIKENRPGSRRPAVLVIGPAGENMVSFAVIENDYWRSAGRTGVGAVMGSKNIKAIAFWGDRKKDLADAKATMDIVKEFVSLAKEDAGVKAYNKMGTPMMVDIMSHVGSFPSRYWHEGTVEHRENINADALQPALRRAAPCLPQVLYRLRPPGHRQGGPPQGPPH